MESDNQRYTHRHASRFEFGGIVTYRRLRTDEAVLAFYRQDVLLLEGNTRFAVDFDWGPSILMRSGWSMPESKTYFSFPLGTSI